MRWSVPGDHARLEADGTITVLGRGSVSINTGGEKVYPEEVESALKSHDDVFDAVVVGVPDDRWGERVVAVVQRRAGATVQLDALVDHVHGAPRGVQGAARAGARRLDRALAVGQARLPLGAGAGRGGRRATRLRRGHGRRTRLQLLDHADAVTDRQQHDLHAVVLHDGVVEARGSR